MPFTAGFNHTELDHAEVLSDGSFLVTGTENFVPAYYFLSRSGSLLGKLSPPHTATFFFIVNRVLPRPGGGFYVVGTATKDGHKVILVDCIGANRQIVYTKTFSFDSAGDSNLRAVALGPSDSLYFVGSGQRFDQKYFSGVMAVTQAGGVLYNAAFDDDLFETSSGKCIFVDPDGYANIGGTNANSAPVFRRLNQNGIEVTTFNQAESFGAFSSICHLATGGYVLAASGATNSTVFVGPDGALLNTLLPGTEEYGGLITLAVPTGAVRLGISAQNDFFAIKDDVSQGSINFGTWIRTLTATSTSLEFGLTGIADQFGETYMLGSTASSATMVDSRFVLAKTSSNGVNRWVEFWAPTPGLACSPAGMALHQPSGDIVVVGSGGPYPSKKIGLAIYRQSPTAIADLYPLPKNTAKYVSPRTVTNNDRFWQGAVVSLVQGPTHGSLTLRSNGTFDYKPNAGFVGSDPWTYRLTKASVSSTTAVVTMSVRNP